MPCSVLLFTCKSVQHKTIQSPKPSSLCYATRNGLPLSYAYVLLIFQGTFWVWGTTGKILLALYLWQNTQCCGESIFLNFSICKLVISSYNNFTVSQCNNLKKRSTLQGQNTVNKEGYHTPLLSKGVQGLRDYHLHSCREDWRRKLYTFSDFAAMGTWNPSFS